MSQLALLGFGLPSFNLRGSALPATRKGTAYWLRLTTAVIFFNLLIAAGIYFSNPDLGTFPSVVTYAQCVGLSIYALHCLLDLVPPVPVARAVREVVTILLAAPSGFLIGSRFAATLLHDPTSAEMPRSQLIITIVASTCIVYFFWARNRIAEESAAHARAEQLASEAELRLLRAQIEPHMLFNTLANLRVLVGVDRARAEAMLDQLIVFLRSSLSASRTEMRSIGTEFEQLSAYLGLMQVRMAERLDYHLHCPANMQSIMVPAMLLQPLVENAIKHGLEPAIEGGRLDIKASLRAQHICLEVADTGVGLLQGGAAGYGLIHIKERIEVLYRGQASFSITDNEGRGAKATLLLPRMDDHG
jgi:hypothetical protein